MCAGWCAQKNDSLFIFDEKTYILAHTLHGFLGGFKFNVIY